VIGYWKDTDVCLSVRLSVTLGFLFGIDS